MQVIINGLDYTAALDASRPLTIERKLNQPSACAFVLALPSGSSLPLPARMQYVAVTSQSGTVYFTGYLADAPLAEFAGLAMQGPSYRYALQAVSDEIVLDEAAPGPALQTGSQSAGTLLAASIAHTGNSSLSTSALSLSNPVASLTSRPGALWSQIAAAIANQVRAAYRVLSGCVSLQSIPCAIHSLAEADGSLTLANLSLTSSVRRNLANDITVCGQHEPGAYVTEFFQADGTTTQFYLSATPFFLPAAHSTLIAEDFNQPAIDLTRWSIPARSTAFSLGPAGLVLSGGTGVDGQAQCSWINPVEMGGTLLLESTGIVLDTGSTGILAALYAGVQTAAGCIAGFQAVAQQGTGTVTLQPLILGQLSGSAYTVNPANQYTLRIRIHCAEQQRTLATYMAGGASVGGQGAPLPAQIQCELQEFVNGVAGMPVSLYDGSIAALPVACTPVVASSVNLNGSVRAFHLTSLGSAWVTSTPPNGSPSTCRLGTAAQGAQCHVERSAKLVFYTGCAPAAGQRIAVSYRTSARAVGRAATGTTPTSAWIGTVTNPPARSSADCRNAASALLQAANNTALWCGAYKGTNFDFASDVWPGDALALNAPSCNLNAQLIARSVRLTCQPTSPDLVDYEVAFANDWVEDLAIHTTATVPDDTWLPAAVAPTLLPGLSALTVTATGSTVTVNTGVAPPAGGGFEVRRRDYAFMAGEDSGLVMRAPQQTLTFARLSANDAFYIRMYDGATPPNYSEFSAALFLNLPLGS